MALKRPLLLMSFVLALSSIGACTHNEKAIDESLDSLPPASAGEEVNFDAAPQTEGGSGAAASDQASEASAPDFTDPKDVGLSPEMEGKLDEGAGEDKRAAAEIDTSSPEDAAPLEYYDESGTAQSTHPDQSPSFTPAPVESSFVNVTFAKNSSKVKKRFRLPLKEIASRLKADAQLTVQLIGHTDARGSSTYNKKLSLKRARAVRAALVRLGVKAKQIELEAVGKQHLLVAGNGERAHAQNRRVEVKLK